MSMNSLTFKTIDSTHTRIFGTVSARSTEYAVDAVVRHGGFPGTIDGKRTTIELVNPNPDAHAGRVAEDREIIRYWLCNWGFEYNKKHRQRYVDLGRVEIEQAIAACTDQLDALEQRIAASVQAGEPTDELWTDAHVVLNRRASRRTELVSYDQRHPAQAA